MRILLVSLGMLAIVGAVLGQVVELGDQFGINDESAEAALRPAMAMGSDGNFIVVWGSTGGLPPLERISARRFAADGSPLGEAFQVNTYTSSIQSSPEVAVDGAGGFFVVWVSDLEDGDVTGIQGRRFDASGSALGDAFQVNTYTTNRQSSPAVSSDTAGNSVVVWNSREQDGCGGGIFGQRFDAVGDPSGDEFQVNVYTDCFDGASQSSPDVAMMPGGDFLVAWNGVGGQFDRYDIWGRLFASDGNPRGDEFQINTFEDYAQISPAIGVAPSGEFVVSWNYYYQGFPFPSGGIFGQRFDSSGGKIGEEFEVDPFSNDHVASPDIAIAPDGEFVVAWTKFYYYDFYKFSTEIFARRFDSDGSPQGDKFLVNNDTSYDQWHPRVAMDPNHQFVVVWRDQSYPDGFELVGQRYADAEVFSDSFESGDTMAWSETEP